MHVIPGSASGLTGTGSQYWSQISSGIVDTRRPTTRSVPHWRSAPIDSVAGEDLAIGVPGEDVGAVVDGGVVHVLYGSAAGLSSTGSQQWSQDSSGITDSVETGDRFGSAIAIGKLDSGAFADLVVGVPERERRRHHAGAGVVQVLPGASGGLTATGSQLWSQNSVGIADSAETDDGFGSSPPAASGRPRASCGCGRGRAHCRSGASRRRGRPWRCGGRRR